MASVKNAKPGYEVRFSNEKKGNGLFTRRCYSENEVIFEEKPLVSCQFAWNESYYYKACHHCMRPLESTEENIRRLTNNSNIVIPFPEQCPTNANRFQYCEFCGVQFCSDKCKKESVLQYHTRICFGKHREIGNLYEMWKMMHYPPETSTIMLIVRMLAIIDQSHHQEATISAFLEFAHETTDKSGSIINFLGDKFMDKFTQLQSLMSKIFTSDATRMFVTDEGLKTLFAIAARNAQGIGTSVFSCWLKNIDNLNLSKERRDELNELIDYLYGEMDNHVGHFLNNEGSGLYRLERCINHSCVPNATITFPHNDHTLVLVAKTRIIDGEEIIISYLDDCELKRSRHSRNKHLREHYLFECDCDKCLYEYEDPDVTSDEEDDESDA